MIDGLLDSAANVGEPDDGRIYGVAIAVVIDNMDLTGAGRVQVKLPWLPDVEPWARVAVSDAGDGRGTWFMPHVDDEVVVGFEQGDVRRPIVLGALWSMTSRPPTDLPIDATYKQVVKTEMGHEIVIDDTPGMTGVTVTTIAGHKIDINDIEGITLETVSGAKVELTTAGQVSVSALTTLELSAPMISIKADGLLDISGGVVSVSGDATCSVSAAMVRIN
jgi:uncharacterized protein involved in type VI secretion and phage assembly